MSAYAAPGAFIACPFNVVGQTIDRGFVLLLLNDQRSTPMRVIRVFCVLLEPIEERTNPISHRTVIAHLLRRELGIAHLHLDHVLIAALQGVLALLPKKADWL